MGRPPDTPPAVSHRLREIRPDNKHDLAIIAQLHMELLDYGPMAGLGELFIRKIGYAMHMADGLLKVALYEVEGQAAGFMAYTSRSISFHRAGLKQHWPYVAWIVLLSILQDLRRLRRLLRAVRVLLSRRGEQRTGTDPLGEIVAIAVRRDYANPTFVRETGLRVGAELVAHARSELKHDGVSKIRMLVDADNKAALFFYHNLGAYLAPYQQAGEPMVQVWFDLEERPRPSTGQTTQ
ncbi:MAG: GNAT family N-acetyltransferase [Acidiferrobacterales bacterium]